ncbi:MAG: DUF4332 domain-containing protein [Candidatus Korarchaeota archaeon]|nr:DUF4332 domain-containing protein [Candidatus Korarchaeota archaeon]
MVKKQLSYSIKTMEGIKETYTKKLREAGIRTIGDLLRAGAEKSDRKKLAKRTGISEKKILRWVNKADLLRVPGIGEEYSYLLEQAGVNTTVELSKRNPDNLYETLVMVNKRKKVVRRLPTRKQVASWIQAAKKLERIIEY